MGDEKQLSIGSDIRTLDDAQKAVLYESIRFIEGLEEDIKDLRDDSNERKALVREQFGIDNDVLSFVLKRRKKRPDERANFDDVVTLIEEYVADAEAKKADEVRDRIERAREKPAEEETPEPDEIPA